MIFYDSIPPVNIIRITDLNPYASSAILSLIKYIFICFYNFNSYAYIIPLSCHIIKYTNYWCGCNCDNCNINQSLWDALPHQITIEFFHFSFRLYFRFLSVMVTDHG
eukprot:345679_1